MHLRDYEMTEMIPDFQVMTFKLTSKIRNGMYLQRYWNDRNDSDFQRDRDFSFLQVSLNVLRFSRYVMLKFCTRKKGEIDLGYSSTWGDIFVDAIDKILLGNMMNDPTNAMSVINVVITISATYIIAIVSHVSQNIVGDVR